MLVFQEMADDDDKGTKRDLSKHIFLKIKRPASIYLQFLYMTGCLSTGWIGFGILHIGSSFKALVKIDNLEKKNNKNRSSFLSNLQ